MTSDTIRRAVGGGSHSIAATSANGRKSTTSRSGRRPILSSSPTSSSSFSKYVVRIGIIVLLVILTTKVILPTGNDDDGNGSTSTTSSSIIASNGNNDGYYNYYYNSVMNSMATMTSTSTESTASSTESPPPNTTPRDSSTATVLAMATGYMMSDYKRFVGSLRKTGYTGHIILAIAPDIPNDAYQYLLDQNVTTYKVQKVNCTFMDFSKSDESKLSHDQKEQQTCLYPYPNLKHRWARYALLRDLFRDCTTCTGPALHVDVRDTIFQRDPFGPDAPPVYGLQVFEESYLIRTTHWVASVPIRNCKHAHFNEPMLCSGSTVGTRTALLEYLNVMVEEMNAWTQDPKCCCLQANYDDQSIHNWLYYGTDLLRQRPGSNNEGLSPSQIDRQRRINAVAIVNRDGIVNTVGAQASRIWNHHEQLRNNYDLKPEIAATLQSSSNKKGTANVNPNVPYPIDGIQRGYNIRDPAPNSWLGVQYGMTDEQGYLVQNDGSRSFVIHQIDRFGPPIYQWIRKTIID